MARTGRFWRSDLFQNWLARRMPAESSVRLHQGNIFILPTRAGVYFTIVMLLMVLAAINYQNSLIFALAFLLVSLFMVSILHTFRNLSGITVQRGGSRPAFAGEDAEFTVIVNRKGRRTHEAIMVGWDREMMQGIDLIDDEEVRVHLFVPTEKRGRFNPGRMLVETAYPVGLFEAWSWIDLGISTVVYPRPVFTREIPESVASGREGDMVRRDGVDDFLGLRNYRDGDPFRHIAWKSYARTEDLQVKEFGAFADRRVWLDWNWFSGMGREDRLSRLCHFVLKLSGGADEYGLRLPGIEIAPDRGPEHRERLLTELALFESA